MVLGVCQPPSQFMEYNTKTYVEGLLATKITPQMHLLHTMTIAVLPFNRTYLDGVSITHGHHPRKHIWSFAAALDEAGTTFPTTRCPCTRVNVRFPGVIPPFVGQDYFCDTGSRSTYQNKIYSDDPLWDGHGCGAGSSCCRFNSPPWFCKQLSQPTSDDVELRLCADQNLANEDILIELVELYVQ